MNRRKEPRDFTAGGEPVSLSQRPTKVTLVAKHRGHNPDPTVHVLYICDGEILYKITLKNHTY